MYFYLKTGLVKQNKKKSQEVLYYYYTMLKKYFKPKIKITALVLKFIKFSQNREVDTYRVSEKID